MLGRLSRSKLSRSLLSWGLLTGGIWKPRPVTLRPLTLSASTISEGAALGAVVGAVQGESSGSTVALTDTAGGLFDLVDGYIELAGALDYETASFHDVSLSEDHPEVAEPRVTVIRIYVTNVLEVTLAPLSLSSSTIQENAAEDTVVGTVQGLSSGSTWSLTNDAGGRFKKSGNSIVAGATATDYEAATSHQIELEEDNPDGANSPRRTTLAIAVADVNEAVLTVLTREADETVTVETLAATWSAALTREPDGTVTISEAA